LERKYLSCFLCPFPSQFIFPPFLPYPPPFVKEGWGGFYSSKIFSSNIYYSKNLPLPLFKKEGKILHYFSLPFSRGGRGRGYKRRECKV
jgi:hypothetical protein